MQSCHRSRNVCHFCRKIRSLMLSIDSLLYRAQKYLSFDIVQPSATFKKQLTSLLDYFLPQSKTEQSVNDKVGLR